MTDGWKGQSACRIQGDQRYLVFQECRKGSCLLILHSVKMFEISWNFDIILDCVIISTNLAGGRMRGSGGNVRVVRARCFSLKLQAVCSANMVKWLRPQARRDAWNSRRKLIVRRFALVLALVVAVVDLEGRVHMAKVRAKCGRWFLGSAAAVASATRGRCRWRVQVRRRHWRSNLVHDRQPDTRGHAHEL